jgi:hypothetical protein
LRHFEHLVWMCVRAKWERKQKRRRSKVEEWGRMRYRNTTTKKTTKTTTKKVRMIVVLYGAGGPRGGRIIATERT